MDAQAGRVNTLLTPWGETLNRALPLAEYPRPQMRREAWQCLNGVWQYAIRDDDAPPDAYDGEIVVPFSPESALSGVGRQLLPGQTLWYRRAVWFEGSGGRLLLHFGAVDQRCRVYLNGEDVGGHEGGYWPFALDVTDAARAGENELLVAAWDDSDGGAEAWGKQRIRRGGIWYTAQSGIWQTVWAERVPGRYIARLEARPCWEDGAVEIEVEFGGDDGDSVARIDVLDADNIVSSGELANSRLRLAMPEGFRSWSPDDPFLYGLRVRAGEDAVEGYFGMRSFSIARDEAGHARLTLNGRTLFHSGLLDQGYWSDGFYTPPSDEAMVWEIERVKAMGFNMLRKHIKIEPMRWYYHCDRLGMLVWQDMVSGGDAASGAWPYRRSMTQVLPFIGVTLSDRRHGLFGRADAAGREAFLRDMARTVRLLRGVVSIAAWVPFNEGWGQFDALAVTQRLREMDDTRAIDHASGWMDQGGGDFASLHVYFRRYRPRPDKRGRVLALTEFGGYSLPVKGHVASDKTFGYKVFDERAAYEDALLRLYEEEVAASVPKGLAAAVYTQVSDVEDEINGLFTYDRRVTKVDEARLRAMNARLTGYREQQA